jgi:type VI protein secretion system component VasK
MSPNRLRAALIAALILAAVLNVAGTKEHSQFVGWLSFAVFLVGVFLYTWWRREVLRRRRARVLDREAQTTRSETHDETGTRTDQ